jgi:hypothetical protein
MLKCDVFVVCPVAGFYIILVVELYVYPLKYYWYNSSYVKMRCVCSVSCGRFLDYLGCRALRLSFKIL